MPHKLNDAHREKFPKAKYRVTNWSEYDRGLVQRGDVRFWGEQEVIDGWVAPIRPVWCAAQRDRDPDRRPESYDPSHETHHDQSGVTSAWERRFALVCLHAPVPC